MAGLLSSFSSQQPPAGPCQQPPAPFCSTPHCFDRLSRWETPARHGPFPWLPASGSFVCYRYPAYTDLSSFSPPSARQSQELTQSFLSLLTMCNLSLLFFSSYVHDKPPSLLSHIPTYPTFFLFPLPHFSSLQSSLPRSLLRTSGAYIMIHSGCMNVKPASHRFIHSHPENFRSLLLINLNYRRSMILL